jgi:Transposase
MEAASVPLAAEIAWLTQEEHALVNPRAYAGTSSFTSSNASRPVIARWLRAFRTAPDLSLPRMTRNRTPGGVCLTVQLAALAIVAAIEQLFLHSLQINVVRSLLRQWCTNVLRSKVQPMKEVAQLIRNHLKGVIGIHTWAQTRQTNGFLEAINGLFQSRQTQGPGLRPVLHDPHRHLPACR